MKYSDYEDDVVCPHCGHIDYAFWEYDSGYDKKDAHPDVGDYVLATKYDEGDPCDHFVVGFVSGYTDHTPPRYMIVDNEGHNQRCNGFRRAERITETEGRMLVEIFPQIGDKIGPSVWWHLSKIRRRLAIAELERLRTALTSICELGERKYFVAYTTVTEMYKIAKRALKFAEAEEEK
jgi:hypothetical protein